ncbi:hypothetical protein GAPWKB11_1362 [Gilliamella apicola]|nr:hypothetical protein GAPWKB11_1362 [Gilliamella apicola]
MLSFQFIVMIFFYFMEKQFTPIKLNFEGDIMISSINKF